MRFISCCAGPGTVDGALGPEGKRESANLGVTSKAAADTLPVEARCWLSSGADDVNLEEEYLGIFGEVTQEGNPVLNAIVE